MGISLHNIAKKIEDIAGGVERQINPFDNGATYSNPNPAPQPTAQAPAPTAQNGPVPVHPNMPLPGSFFGPNPLNPQLAPTPVTTTQNSKPKHSAIPTPPLGIPTPTLQPGTMPTPGPLNLGGKILTPKPLPTGPESSVNPLQAARGLAQGVARGIYEIPTSIGQAVEGHPITTQPSTASKFLFGDKPFQTIQEMGASTAQAHPGGFQVGPVHLTPKEAGVAETGLQLAQDVPLVSGIAAKAAKVLTPVNDATKVALLRQAASQPKVVTATKPTVKAVQAAEEIAPTEKAAATTVAQGAPASQVATAAPLIPKTAIPEVDKAIQDVSNQYATPTTFNGGVQDVVQQAQGASTIGSRAANGLRKALSNNLTKKDNQAVSDILDSHPGAYKAASQKAQTVADALKPLQDQGFGIRQAIDPNVNKVQDYVTRIRANSVGAAADAGSKVLGKIRSLSDITNLNSVFSQTRQVGKFVGDDGKAVYGNPSTLGLVRHTDGTITDASGNGFKQVAVSKRELEANGAGKYEHNISRISGIYHADTASLKVRAEALQHIKTNPEAMGLSKVQEPGMVPISKVKELNEYYGAPKDVKALEDNFGYKNAPGPVGKAYDAVSNVATQFIVLNPFFHGMNQLYQTAIAAGNMPGLGTGWMKVAGNVFKVGEQDIRDYLSAGGHIPDYGMNRENLLSKLSGGTTKINNKAMNAIETKLRTGLYKSSIEKGMTPKAAVQNIDKFLGDSHQMSAATRRFTLFFHYFKTMGGALYQQGRHPIENAGATFNTAALAALTAAVTYGYRDFTGNKDAYVRVPGELGLIKEGVQSAEGLAHGDAGKATQVVTNRINPVLKEGIQQGMPNGGIDLFTGKHLTEEPGGRAGHAVSSLIAPAQVASRVGAGSKSKAEVGLNQLGLYTPHAKGYQASPNLPINTKDAIPGNGVKEQTAYFNGLAAAKKSVAGDTASTDALTKYLGRSHDPNTGQSIQNSPSESQQNSEALATNDKLRNTVQKFEKSQPSHDPIWNLPADQLKALMQYKSQFTGDAAKNVMFANANSIDGSNWIKDIEAKQNDYYNNIKYPGGSKIPEKNPQTPNYPKFSDFTQSLLDTYDNGSPQDKAALLQNYGPELSDAWGQKSDWTNAMRRAEGTLELKGYPKADEETQAILNTYNALPQHDGSKGGNASRYAWGQANPAAYAKMQDYLSQAAMSSLVKNASLDQFKGTDADQALLKDIKNVGTYDIATTKNADGSKSYALDPAAASAASSAYASSFKSGSSYNPNKQLARNAKAMAYHSGIPKIGAKIKRPSVKLSKSSTSVKFKGTPKLAKSSKVALKPSKV